MNSHKTTSSGEGTKRSTADGSGIRAPAKLQAHHLSRLAIVYVRQSTPQQVQDHKESAARQYALVNLAVEMGWPADRIQVIDEDQGHSGARRRLTPSARSSLIRCTPARTPLESVKSILGARIRRSEGPGASSWAEKRWGRWFGGLFDPGRDSIRARNSLQATLRGE